jgi:hypothetical protein
VTLEEIFGINELPAEPTQLVLVVAVALGALYCFVGYRLIKVVLAITGLVLAGAVALFLGSWVMQGDQYFALLFALVGGAAGAYSMFYLYRGGIFMVGMLGALVIANNGLALYEEAWAPAIAIAVGLVGGTLAIYLERPLVTLATAALGGWVCITGIVLLVKESKEASLDSFMANGQAGFGIMASWAVLAIAGAVVQWNSFAQDPEVVKEVVREYKK